jgi:hypothetical protein
LTIDLENERMVLLDRLRRARNVNDYSDDVVREEEAASCVRLRGSTADNPDRLA